MCAKLRECWSIAESQLLMIRAHFLDSLGPPIKKASMMLLLQSCTRNHNNNWVIHTQVRENHYCIQVTMVYKPHRGKEKWKIREQGEVAKFVMLAFWSWHRSVAVNGQAQKQEVWCDCSPPPFFAMGYVAWVGLTFIGSGLRLSNLFRGWDPTYRHP